MLPIKKNLLIAAIGSRQEWHSWFDSSSSADFDFIALCYEKVGSNYLKEAIDVKFEKGFKFQLIYNYLYRNSILEKYNSIFMPDDDLVISTTDINRLFEYLEKYQLNLIQPALDLQSYYSHKITRFCNLSEVIFRYTDFVEVMCPLFSKIALKKCLETFLISPTGYGIDFVWPMFLNYSGIAIIDAIQVKHYRKITSSQNLKKKGVKIKKFISDIAGIYGVRSFSPRCFAEKIT